MDASNRFFQVYGKTASGTSAMNLTRTATSSASRRVLIMVDGKRTRADLAATFDPEVLERSMQELESKGYIELLRHFPEMEEESPEPAPAARPSEEAVPERAPAIAQAPAGKPEALDGPVTRVAHAKRNILFVVGLVIVCGLALLVTIGGTRLWRELPAIASDVARVPVIPPAPVPPVTAAPSFTRAPPAARKPLAAKAAPPRDDAVSLGEFPPGRAPIGAVVQLQVRTQVAPLLPRAARDLGVKSGHVVVVLHVDPQGKVQRVELVSATPPEAYDSAMEAAFSQWTFDPPGVAGRMTVDIDIVPPTG